MNAFHLATAWLERQWYSKPTAIRVLIPLSWLFLGIVAVRRALYAWGWLKSSRLDCPVIVVGNITVGGTGKTPLVIWIAEFLKQRGWNPGIVSRGYRGSTGLEFHRVTKQSDPRDVGDEAVVIARHTDCPMVVGRDRAKAARILRSEAFCDIIVSDDGLQHYGLDRDLEIAVVDAARGLGNGYGLPAGPLREAKSRLQSVDLVVYNGLSDASSFAMTLTGEVAVNNAEPLLKAPLKEFQSKPCHALAGIGNPGRFFSFLSACGLSVEPHGFPDHHAFTREDLRFDDDLPVLMTEKDAVKCLGFSRKNHWHVPVEAQLDREFGEQLLQLLEIKTK